VPRTSMPSPEVRLDLGCGKSKKAGFFGIDRRKFEGVDAVADLSEKTWVFLQPQLGKLQLIPIQKDGSTMFVLPASSVAEIHCSHFLEHLEHNQRRPERVRFMNELWRVLMPGGVGTIVTPHWASNRTYGDFTHADKPVAESFYMYLNRDWRHTNAPDNDVEFNPDGYDCDFDFEIGYGLHPDFEEQPNQKKDFALKWYKDAVVELHARIIARK
jgi:SAM-dependent methyltransferase